MRIDGPTSFSSLDRGARPGVAVTPLREVQREQEQRREQPALPASSQGFEAVAQVRRVQAGNASSDNLPARLQDQLAQRGLSNRATQALASYGSTASFAGQQDAQEVLGLDLYA
ncbi:MAG: hypothetical protein A2Y50_11825 [Pseudomonadales bacterium RIFCSPLOWO2_12_59_9]|nr:hypothetical protein [Pseudomonas sp.]OHC28019.1 MAG: hypothetical protein A2Y50_11825 [Pseudomonadales bacterium RIFCSPLOWO2_12_59_9]